MSELRIALVAEGPTDYEAIQAALKALLPQPFVMIQLQPEATGGMMGTGWCGVLKWCQAAQQRHPGSLDKGPTLVGFDLLIVHLDVDVASKQYADCGTSVADIAQQHHWGSLPCAQPSPPVADTVTCLDGVIKSWLGQSTAGERTLLCLPAQSSGTWLAAAVLASAHPLLVDSECNLSLESRLGQLPLKERIKKTTREYRLHAPRITAQWEQVKQVCTQATHFEQQVLAALESIKS